MNREATTFLKLVLIMVGLAVAIGLIWFPQLEGRNENADWVSIYLKDPLLAYTYIAAIPFFVALYQVFTLLGYIEQNQAFSPLAVRTLRNIKYCTIATIGFIIIGELFIIFAVDAGEDKAGIFALGIYSTVACIIITAAMAIFERLLQNAVALKAENDLTV